MCELMGRGIRIVDGNPEWKRRGYEYGYEYERCASGGGGETKKRYIKTAKQMLQILNKNNTEKKAE